MTIPIKKCPFCGGEAILTKDEQFGVFYVFCKECLRNSDSDKIEQKAIEKWNTRPLEDAKDKEIERLKNDNKRLRSYLKTARYYLSKVDYYIEPIADEAHYFWDIYLERVLIGEEE